MLSSRKKLLIGPIQYRLLAFGVTYVMVLIGAFFLTFFVPLIIKLRSSSVPEAERQRAADQFLELHTYGWYVIAGLVVLFMLHMVLVSHRIAGPLYRFRMIFEQILHGDLTVPVRLRKKDYFQEEAAVLARTVDKLRLRIVALKSDASQVARVGSDIAFSAQEGELEDTRRHSEELGRRIAVLQKQMSFFKTSGEEKKEIAGDSEVARPAGTRGFTLVELVIIVSILGILATVGLPNYTRALEAAKVARAIGDIRAIEKDIAAYQAIRSVPPPNLLAIDKDTLKDPWAREYVYLNFVASGADAGQMRKDRFLVPLNSKYDLYSSGKDGISKMPLAAKASLDDVIRANDGGFVGLATSF